MARPSLPAAAALALLAAAGCASLSPRFPLEVSSSFAHEPMRKVETAHLELYYPAARQKQAYQVVERLEQCFEQLRGLTATKTPRAKALVYMTSTDFNNAFVYFPLLGNPQQMVLPAHMSIELFNMLELGVTAIPDVSCHEAVHYVHQQQTDGFWSVVNAVFGDYMSPNIFLESWFAEGLATYYESRLGRPVGRPESPIWRATFESGVASRGGELRGGDLNPSSRDPLPYGGPYLVGSYFIDYLVRTYGEQKLWKLIDLQGRSIFSPLWTSLRFGAVYGKTLDQLYADFSAELKKTIKPRKRPAEQKVAHRDMGYAARLSGARDGATASLVARRDDVLQLEVRDPDGKVRFNRGVTPLLPGRTYQRLHPQLVSGLSFSADGQSLYVVVADVAMDGSTQTKLLQLDARNGDLRRSWEGFIAMGGDVAPDGQSYVLVEIADERSNLVRLDLATGQRTPLTSFQEPTALGAPAFSPDGKRIAFVRAMQGGFDLHLLDESGAVKQLTSDDRFDYSPRWIDDDRIILVRESPEGRPQLGVYQVSTGDLRLVTDAPYAALEPALLAGGKVAFLNRDGWNWTMDTVPLPAAPAAPAVPAESPAPETPSAPPTPPEAGTGGAGEAITPGERPAAIQKDEPYQQGDHLLLPNFHVPWVNPRYQAVGSSRVWGLEAGLSLQGSDRLGLHNYALNASYDSFSRGPSLSLAYGTSVAAPWWLQAGASYASSAFLFSGQEPGTVETQLLESARAGVAAQRVFWSTPLTLSFDAIGVRRGPLGTTPESRVLVVGPQVSTSYLATEGTAYGGTRAGLGLSGFAAAYPAFLGSSVNMADLGAQLTAYVPLPFTARHTLRLTGRGRYLPGAPAGMLQVGGVPVGIDIYAGGGPDTPPGPSLPGVSFVETFRGYEDSGFRGTYAALGEARYRLTFPIDAGTLSILSLLPSFFLSEVDLELFGGGAYVNDDVRRRYVVGGALLVRTVWGGSIPLSFVYQYSNRFGTIPDAHLFTLAFE